MMSTFVDIASRIVLSGVGVVGDVFGAGTAATCPQAT